MYCHLSIVMSGINRARRQACPAWVMRSVLPCLPGRKAYLPMIAPALKQTAPSIQLCLLRDYMMKAIFGEAIAVAMSVFIFF